MRLTGFCLVMLLLIPAAAAQAPSRGPEPRDAAIQQKQRQAGAAFSNLQKAQYEAKLAEQDFLNAQDAYAATQKQSEDHRRELETARKALDAAQAKVAQARKRYEDAVSEVDQAFQRSATGDKK